VLLSGATHDLVADHHQLTGVEFVDLGTHRLRDLARPEHVFQLCHPDLAGEFPPLRGLDAVPNNLPTQLTSFIGRSAEVAEVARLVTQHRLVTLTGSGGCGKTRLAVQAAAELSASFPDGAWFVDLSPVGESGGVGIAVAAALGTPMVPGQAPLDALVARARTSALLVVLDNCEHLVEACSETARALLQACPEVRVLATSRELLGVEGEVAWRVPSLSLPAADAPPRLDALATCDAVRLFVDRAVQARPNFAVSNETAADVAAICRRLDGIPLAIELAAARVRVLSPAQIASGLDDRFRVLGAGARTALARQQTLAASVAWSHDLLADSERAVFRRLSVFAGSFDLDAAEAVAAAGDVASWAVLDVLAALVDKSLVQAEDEGVATRYRLLETLRAFAADRLADAGETDAAFDRAARHYLARAEALGESGYGQLLTELDTIRPVVSWALASGSDLALPLATVLALDTGRANDFATGRRWLESALASDPGTDRLARARALAELAYVCFPLMDLAPIPAVAAEAISLGRELGDDRSVARALNARGWALGTVFGLEHGAADLDEAIELSRKTGDTWCLIDALKNRGYVSLGYGDPVSARPRLEEAVAAARAAGDAIKADEAALWLAWVEMWTGNVAEARARVARLASAFEARRIPFFACVAFGYVAMIGAWLGEIDDSRRAISRARELAGQAATVNPWLEANALLCSSHVELAAGNLQAAREQVERAAEVCGPGSPAVMRVPVVASLATVLAELGDVAAARRANAEVRAAAERASMGWHLAAANLTDARIALIEGEPERAEDLAHESLAGAAQQGDQVRVVECLELLARLAAAAESFAEAARLAGAASAMRERIGYVPLAPHRTRSGELDTALRDALGDEDLARLLDEGAALDAEAAVAYARRGRGERGRPSSGWASLTPTELEVTRLVAEGLTNPQVAERLLISRATVKAHLGHIFTKLGVATRAELAALATRKRLSIDADTRG
jgi:predicted ATPase/DNA-binding CsgD family transcriptional regulator